jgi:adenylate cyclase
MEPKRLSAFRGEPEVSLKEFEKALRLSPFDPMNFNCYFGMGLAHLVARRPEQSIESILRGLAERPHATWIYRMLIPALVEAGRLTEARERMSVLKRDYPNLTIRAVREALAFHTEEIIDRYAAGLRQAGLPE